MSQCLRFLAHIAAHLGRPDDSLRYAAQRQALNDRIHRTFYHEDGIYGTGTQIDLAYPLLVGAVPDSLTQRATQQLLSRTDSLHRNHIACGLVGVPVLTEWATQAGKADFFHSLLSQPDYPGYLHMMHNGATAVWESWNGQRSRLHNCYNGIGTWFYQALGGTVATAPGYRHVVICPQAPAALRWADVSQQTPYGTLRVSWRRHAHHLRIRVTIPVGITAHIYGQTYTNGTHTIVRSIE